MGDLISRSALINIIKDRASEHRDNWESFMNYMGERKTIHYTELKECKSIIDIIENQPTAYDVDKVVEELEEASEKRWLVLAERNGYKRAIEIVKGGGVNERD